MDTCLVLLGLLSLSSLSFGQECRQEFLVNVDFPGTNITVLASPDVEHCQLLCTQFSSCLFFTFIRSDWTKDNGHFQCHLKSTSSGEPNSQTPLLGVTSGFSLKHCNPEPQPCLSQVYKNVDFHGEDYKVLFTTDFENCQKVCTQDPDCQFFTFTNEDFIPSNIRYKCHLKFSWNIPRTPIVERKAGLVSGFSLNTQITKQFDTACQKKLFLHTDIPGNDIQTLKAVSVEYCQALCSSHPQCTFFSFFSDEFSCYLKNNPNEMVKIAKEGVTSGLPAHLCQLDDNWIQTAYEGIDFRGSDIRFEVTDDPETCQKKCTEEPDCQFYTYLYPNEKFDRAYWRCCYLKRVITMPAPPKVRKLANAVSGFSLKNCLTSVQ